VEDRIGEEIILLDQQYKTAYADGQFYIAVEVAFQLCMLAREYYGETETHYAACLNNLGAAYEALGDYRSAEQLYWQAVEIDAHSNRLGYAQDLFNVAHLCKTVGRYAEAEVNFRRSLDIKEDILGDFDPDVARNLNGLGHLRYLQSDYSAAETLYKQALQIWRDHPESTFRQIAIGLNNLAMLYEDTGDDAAAERFYLETLEIDRQALSPEHPEYATSLNNLASFYCKFGNFQEAEKLFDEGAHIVRTALGEGHLDYANCLNNLGWMNYLQGDYQAAEANFLPAFEIRRDQLGENHPLVAQSHNNLGAVFREKGKLTTAQDHYLRALGTYRWTLGEAHPDIAIALNNLALLFAATGNTSQALDLMLEAAAVVDQLVGEIFSIASERRRLAYVEQIKWHVDSFLSLMVESQSPSQPMINACMDLVLKRKGIVIEALAAQRDVILDEEHQELEARLQELGTLRAQIAERTIAGPGTESLAVHMHLLAAWNAHKETLESEYAQLIPGLDFAQRLWDADQQSVASALPEGTALIEFVRFLPFDFHAVQAEEASRWKPAHYAAFVLLTGPVDGCKFIDLGEADPINQMILDFRRSITGEDERGGFRLLRSAPSEAPGDIGIDLRTTLFEPLLPAFYNCKRLFLAPDGDLSRLPFEVLPLRGGRCVIDDFNISYLNTGRDLLRLGATSTGQPTAPVVIADPNFDLVSTEVALEEKVDHASRRQSRDLDRSERLFNRLPGTRMEGEKVAAMLGVEPWLEDEALEAMLKECRSPHILHIATHGFFLVDQEREPDEIQLGFMGTNIDASDRLRYLAKLENPLLRSGLALAGANTWLKGDALPSEAEDAILNGEDVAGLDLLDTELVVLSACETGLGEVRAGEGVFGLQRSFVLAGVKTLVMSLWKVPDTQTQELMEDFYQRLLSGQSRADALRQAQLALKERYPDPLYWGAFICQGDPGPLVSLTPEEM
jgi:CHAT domain-containing protein/Flp pilus assembly protein TadD